MTRRLSLIFLLVYLIWVGGLTSIGHAAGVPEAKLGEIDTFVTSQMELGKLPGVMVVIVGRDWVYQKGYGYADLASKRPVTPETYFEMGSTSKAFTGLGILTLESSGRIRKSDDIRKYLPWLRMRYVPESKDPTIYWLNQMKIVRKYLPWLQKREEAAITIDHLLHHTSGIPPETIGDIPARNDDGALEATSRMLVGSELDSPPGDQFSYATVNYDILGLLIEKISGDSFENYIKREVLNPLGLNQVCLSRRETAVHDMATGYKISFFGPRAYQAPEYRGNTPAGYFIINGREMTRWLRLQMDLEKTPLSALIEKSHQDLYSYSYGWYTYRSDNINKKIWHYGSNPNFASYIEFAPDQMVGVGVLMNLNSVYSQVIGEGIIYQLTGRGRLPEASSDMYQEVDKINMLMIPGLLFLLAITVPSVVKGFREKHKFSGITRKNMVKFIGWAIIFIAYFLVLFYSTLLIFGYPWSFIWVWGPLSYPITIGLAFVQGVFTYLLVLNRFFFKGNKKQHKPELTWRNLFK